MNPDLYRRYPAVADLAKKAKRRIPHFAWEYLDSGTGEQLQLDRNRKALADIALMPEFMQGRFDADLSTQIFGKNYAMPIGVSPVGLTGLMWPDIEAKIARAATRHNIPYSLSTLATSSAEDIGPHCDGKGWFQLYPPHRRDVRDDLLKRAQDNGFDVMLVTCDVPIPSRRERQHRAGVSVPPKNNLRTFYHCALAPQWSIATLINGLPRFRGVEKYLDSRDMQNMISFIGQEFGRTLDWDYFAELREAWPGKLLLKGIQDPEQAKKSVEMGADGVMVSNHGARQFDGGPAAIECLPAIRKACPDTTIVIDSGFRTGLDVVKAIALGADFVLMGRPFIFGVSALGEKGADHVCDILEADIANNLVQLGCRTPLQARKRLYDHRHFKGSAPGQ